MLVKHCMTPNPRTASPEDDVRQTFELLKAHGFHQLPVVKEGRIVGIVTDRDLRTGLFQPGLKIKDVMTPNPITIFEDVKMEVAAQIINSRRFNAIPVVDSKGDLVGIITTHDIIESFIRMRDLRDEPIKIEVLIPTDVDFHEVLKLFQMSSDKLLSFIKSTDKENTYIFWLRACDFEHVERKLKEKGMEGVKISPHH